MKSTSDLIVAALLVTTIPFIFSCQSNIEADANPAPFFSTAGDNDNTDSEPPAESNKKPDVEIIGISQPTTGIANVTYLLKDADVEKLDIELQYKNVAGQYQAASSVGTTENLPANATGVVHTIDWIAYNDEECASGLVTALKIIARDAEDSDSAEMELTMTSNTPPVVSLNPIVDHEVPLPLFLNVSDMESDNLQLLNAVILYPDGSSEPATVNSSINLQQIPASPSNSIIPITLENPPADDEQIFTLKFTLTDGCVTVTTQVTYTPPPNVPPIIVEQSKMCLANGSVELKIKIIDPTDDVANIVFFEYLNGHVPIVNESLTNIPTGASFTTAPVYTLTITNPPDEEPCPDLEIQAADNTEPGPVKTILGACCEQPNVPPQIEDVRINYGNPLPVCPTMVPIEVNVCDENNDPIDLYFYYGYDDGSGYQCPLMAPKVGYNNPILDVFDNVCGDGQEWETFVWDITQESFFQQAVTNQTFLEMCVDVKITAVDDLGALDQDNPGQVCFSCDFTEPPDPPEPPIIVLGGVEELEKPENPKSPKPFGY